MMYIALPNKHKKIELIVQKLAEIGIDDIVFRKAHRSQLDGISDNKMERLHLIALEAAEQSRNRSIPNIRFCKNTSQEITNKDIIILDKNEKSTPRPHSLNSKNSPNLLFVGPE